MSTQSFQKSNCSGLPARLLVSLVGAITVTGQRIIVVGISQFIFDKVSYDTRFTSISGSVSAKNCFIADKYNSKLFASVAG